MLSGTGAQFSLTSPFCRWLTLRHSCSKLFIGGLSYDTNETVLKDAFGQHGEIVEVKVICDHKTGISKRYGFVHFTSAHMASEALKEMNGQPLDGRNIRIEYAHGMTTNSSGATSGNDA